MIIKGWILPLALLGGSPALAAAPAIGRSECADAMTPAHAAETRAWIEAAMASGAPRAMPANIVVREVGRLCGAQPGLDIARAGSQALLLVTAHSDIRITN